MELTDQQLTQLRKNVSKNTGLDEAILRMYPHAEITVMVGFNICTYRYYVESAYFRESEAKKEMAPEHFLRKTTPKNINDGCLPEVFEEGYYEQIYDPLKEQVFKH